MGFLDDLSRRATDTGSMVAQKAKNYTDVARLNSWIKDEEKNISDIYTQIGKLYVSKHIDDYEPEFQEMFDSIKSSEEKIIKFNEQIETINKTVKCLKCGAEIREGALFCSCCGAPVQKVEPPSDLLKCPKCGADVNKDDRFCMECGYALNIKINEDTQPVPVQNISDERFCPSCGKKIEETDAVFCEGCGAKINQ